MLKILPCLDSEEMAEERKAELRLPRDVCASLGVAALEASMNGFYLSDSGEEIDWSREVELAIRAKISLPPEAALPAHEPSPFAETEIQVANETTLAASRRLFDSGEKPLALNFAKGVFAEGGFLSGARAQEEVLCRSSALYATLTDDPMYEAHSLRQDHASTDWAILSPDVPVFRTDSGTAVVKP